jgi:hypothetical protein
MNEKQSSTADFLKKFFHNIYIQDNQYIKIPQCAAGIGFTKQYGQTCCEVRSTLSVSITKLHTQDESAHRFVLTSSFK